MLNVLKQKLFTDKVDWTRPAYVYEEMKVYRVFKMDYAIMILITSVRNDRLTYKVQDVHIFFYKI
jgi:hypothetical protein